MQKAVGKYQAQSATYNLRLSIVLVPQSFLMAQRPHDAIKPEEDQEKHTT